MNLIAFDLSLRATGYAASNGERLLRVGTIETKLAGMRRLKSIRDQVTALARNARLVLIEGYAYGQARGTSQLHSIGELGGVIRLAIFEAGTPYVDVAPATVKKLATGLGNAPKEAVLSAAIQRLGYQGYNQDEADALWLLQTALQRYEQPARVALPKKHTAALTGVTWPRIGGATP